MAHREVLKSLLRSIASLEREALRMAGDNESSLLFLCSQLISHHHTAAAVPVVSPSSFIVDEDAEDATIRYYHDVEPTTDIDNTNQIETLIDPVEEETQETKVVSIDQDIVDVPVVSTKKEKKKKAKK